MKKKKTVKECKKNTVQPQHTSKGFNCPDACCVKVFASSRALERHLDVGKHLCRLQTESSYDIVKQKWALKFTTQLVSIPKQINSLLASQEKKQQELINLL